MQALNTKVVLKVVEEDNKETRSPGGITLTGGGPPIAVVVSIGEDVMNDFSYTLDEDGNTSVDDPIKAGDKVVYNPSAGLDFISEGTNYIVLEYVDIYCKI